MRRLALITLTLLLAAPAHAQSPNLLLEDWLFDLRRETRSTSVGLANNGRVVNAAAMPLRGGSWRFVKAISGRGTYYGTSPLVDLLATAADTVAEEFPGTVVEFGNFGRRDGGRIVQSKSHQGGRDADVLFPAKDRKGRPRPTGRFLKFGDDLAAPGGWTLDLERTWAFVRALVLFEDPAVQWIFVSAPIRQALLDHARAAGEEARVLRRAAVVLHQPGDSTSHNDHMHVRIFCTSWDLANGCVDYGPTRAHLDRDEGALEQRARHLARRTQRGLPAQRLAALEQLLALPHPAAPATAEALLCDADAGLVERSLAAVRKQTPTAWEPIVAGRLACAANTSTRHLLLPPLMSYRDKRVWRAARRVIMDPLCLDPDACKGPECKHLNRLCAVAARALGYSRNLAHGPRLVDLLESRDSRVRRYALRALRTLYVTRDPALPELLAGPAGRGTAPKSRVQRWRHLVEAADGLRWRKHARYQLLRQGYPVNHKLYDKRNVDGLLAAVQAGFPVSYTAQTTLAKIFNIELPRPLKACDAHEVFQAHARACAAPADRDQALPPLPDLE